MFNLVLNTSLYSIVRDLYLNNFRLKSEIKYKHIYNHQYEVSKAFPSKVSKYGAFSGWYFPVFELNTEIYEVNLRIQSEYRKIPTRKNSVFGYFSRNVSKTAPSKVSKIDS